MCEFVYMVKINCEIVFRDLGLFMGKVEGRRFCSIQIFIKKLAGVNR